MDDKFEAPMDAIIASTLTFTISLTFDEYEWENYELEQMLWLRSKGVSLAVIGSMFKSVSGLKPKIIEQRLTRFHERYRN